MQLSTIPGDAYYYLLPLLKKTKNKSGASTAGAGSRSCGARKRLVGQAKTAMPGMQDHVSARWPLKMVFQSATALGTAVIQGGPSVHRKLSPPLDNWGDRATAPHQGHSKKFNAGGGASPTGGHPGPAAWAQWLAPTRKLPWWARRSAATTGPQARRGSLRWGMDGALASMAALRAWAAWTNGVMSCASGRWAQ